MAHMEIGDVRRTASGEWFKAVEDEYSCKGCELDNCGSEEYANLGDCTCNNVIFKRTTKPHGFPKLTWHCSDGTTHETENEAKQHEETL